MRSKKAQTEIIGFAIIVILLSFGMILVLSLSGGKTPDELNKLNEEIADKFINSVLKTNTDCDLFTINDLLKDVFEYGPSGSIFCEVNGTIYSARKFVDITLEQILSDTFDIWGVGYTFSIYINPENPSFFYENKKCKTSSSAKEYVLPLRDGTPLYIKLRMC